MVFKMDIEIFRDRMAEGYNLLGFHFEDLKYYNLAAECYLKGLDKGCINGAYNFSSLINDKPTRYTYEDSLNYANKYKELSPDDPDAYKLLADIFGKKWKVNEKYENLQKSFDLGNYKLFDNLIHHYHTKQNVEKIKEIVEITYQNHPKLHKSQISRLGIIYSENYYKIGKNMERAIELWEISSELGYSEAFYNLAVSYDGGDGVPRDYQKAFECYVKADELKKEINDFGDVDAKFEIGMFYKKGRAVDKDEEKAKALFTASATHDWQPNPHAMLEMVNYTDNIEEKSDWILKSIPRFKYARDKKKTIEVPYTVLEIWEQMISKDIPKLKEKIVDLECRPPELGGPAFEEAKKRYTDNLKRDF